MGIVAGAVSLIIAPFCILLCPIAFLWGLYVKLLISLLPGFKWKLYAVEYFIIWPVSLLVPEETAVRHEVIWTVYRNSGPKELRVVYKRLLKLTR